MNTTTNKARARKASKKFAPAAWQWDPAQVNGPETTRVQLWSASGCLMGLVSRGEARELVFTRAFFVGSSAHLCQVHDGIDSANA